MDQEELNREVKAVTEEFVAKKEQWREEGVRAAAIQENNREEGREDLENRYGQVWNTDEMRRDFEVLGFGAPCVVVRRRSDGKKGSLFFQHVPRFYYNFEEDK